MFRSLRSKVSAKPPHYSQWCTCLDRLLYLSLTDRRPSVQSRIGPKGNHFSAAFSEPLDELDPNGLWSSPDSSKYWIILKVISKKDKMSNDRNSYEPVRINGIKTSRGSARIKVRRLAPLLVAVHYSRRFSVLKVRGGGSSRQSSTVSPSLSSGGKEG